MAKMEFASLGSGSQGNGTVIRAGDTTLLVDCGFSRPQLEARLNQRDLTIGQLDAILVTHEHEDHRKGVRVVAEHHRIPVYASHGTFEALRRTEKRIDHIEDLIHEIEPGTPFRVKDISVHPIEVPHDAAEPTQYVLRYAGASVGVLTDCGSFTDQMVEHYSGLHAMLLETNHDVDMLENGPYPYFLKSRVGGNHGHLNNGQSRAFADRIAHNGLQHLVFGHISQQNNELQHIERAFDDLQSDAMMTYASQSGGTEWLHVVSNGTSLQ